MKLVSYQYAADDGVEVRTGAELDDEIADLAGADAARQGEGVPAEMTALLSGGKRTMEADRAARDFAAQDGAEFSEKGAGPQRAQTLAKGWAP